MDKIKIFLYEEMYYWLFFYVKKINPNPPLGLKFTAFSHLQLLKLFNILSFFFIIGHFFIENKDYMVGLLIFLLIFWLVTFGVDRLILYPKSDYIITICGKFSKKRQTTGKVKFWVYAGLTFLLLVIGLIYIDK